MASPRFNFRMVAVTLAAASAGLSVAIISLTKVLLVLTALVALLAGRKKSVEAGSSIAGLWTPRVVVVILLAFAASLLWTSAPLDHALGALGKYGKLLVIPAMLLLIRSPKEAAWALASFAGAQAFLLLSSWFLYFQMPVPWATSNMAKTSYAVFSSYLDQGIMSAVIAAIFWHLKSIAPNRTLFYAAIGLSLVALGNVFVVFWGRTGHLVGVAMISMAIFWALPKRYRLLSLLVPPLIFAVAFFSFDKVAQRFSSVQTEVSAYSVKPEAVTSSGVRLSFWKTSVEAIGQHPLAGTGLGSWAREYNRIDRVRDPAHVDLGVGSNPHQEFLLWGVQLGVVGVLLLFAFLLAVVQDLRKTPTPVARAGISVVAGLVLSCLLNSSLYDAYIGDFFCLALSVLLAYGITAPRQAYDGAITS